MNALLFEKSLEKLGMKKIELARILCVWPSEITAFSKGYRTPSLRQAFVISETLGVRLEKLFPGMNAANAVSKRRTTKNRSKSHERTAASHS